MGIQGADMSAAARIGNNMGIGAAEGANLACSFGAGLGHMVGRAVGLIGGLGWKSLNLIPNQFRRGVMQNGR